MPKTITAPKTGNTQNSKNLKSSEKSKLHNPKTYKTTNIQKTKKSSIIRTLFFVMFNIVIILIILFGIITYIQGYVYIPKLLTINNNELTIPQKTSKKILTLKDSHLTKWQILKINIQNSINNKNYTLTKHSQVQAPLAEGINTITLQKIINFKIIKFGSAPKTMTITVDTTPPQLLSKPKITNQGLVLEFTEPTVLKILKPFQKTFRTDDSYTAIIPLNLIKTTNSLRLEFIDKLGNSKQIEVILNKKQIHAKQLSKYNEKELPKSAGLIENVNIVGAVVLFATLSIPSLFIISLNKINQQENYK